MHGWIYGVLVRYGNYVDQVTFIVKSDLIPFNVLGPVGGSGGVSNGIIISRRDKGVLWTCWNRYSSTWFQGETAHITGMQYAMKHKQCIQTNNNKLHKYL